MRRAVTLATVALLAGSGAARSGISEDLVFCSKLSDSRERLACYDAAARIDDRAGRRRQKSKASHQRQASVALPPAKSLDIPQSGSAVALPLPAFSGGYVGMTLGYRIPTGRPELRDNSYGDGQHTFVLPEHMQGISAGAVFGYNFTSGGLLLGFEGRAQYDTSKAYKSAIGPGFDRTMPAPLGGGTCYGCSPDWIDNVPMETSVLLSSKSRNWQKYKAPFSADASARVGAIWDDTLFFARMGAGAEYLEYTGGTGITNVTCTKPIIDRQRPAPNSYRDILIGCKRTQSSYTESISTWDSLDAYFVFGLGVERNFDRYFVRAEGEIRAHLRPTLYYSPHFSATVGLRF